MAASKNPIPDEMTGTDASEDLSVPDVRQRKKAHKLRWGHQDETIPGEDSDLPGEQPAADRPA